jgi:HSP20 family protein
MSLVKATRRIPRLAFQPFSSLGAMPMFDDVENRMRRFFDTGDFGAFDAALAPVTGWMPAMEISESADELTVTAELPGMEQKDIDVSIDDGVLTIRGEKLEERKEGEEGKKFYLSERNYGSFQRTFTLPRTVDAAKISAEFVKGVLTVRLPKTAEQKAKGRKIEIGTAV